VNLTTIVAFVG